MTIASAAPAPAARVVVTATRAATTASPPLSPSVEPGLKPYQPIQRINAPSIPSAIEWPGMAFTEPSSSYLPRRAPTMIAPTSAAYPPTEWTTVEPAKSTMPLSPIGSSAKALTQPAPSQIQ